jgi:hypothetical protein
LQSLVFVEEPYFNEPGYESTMGTTNGQNKSKKYNDNIRSVLIYYYYFFFVIIFTSKNKNKKKIIN